MTTPAPPPADGAAAPTPRSRPPVRVWAVIVAVVVFAAIGIAVLAGGGDDAAPAARPTSSPSPSPSRITPEEQARADLDQLVRDYEVVSNAAFLDPSIEPAPALDDFLRSPALDQAVERMIRARSADGQDVASRTATVHSVTVTALDLAGEPPAATVEECRTIVASGTQKQSGEPFSVDDARRLITWSALIVEDGRWRLFDADAKEPGSC